MVETVESDAPSASDVLSIGCTHEQVDGVKTRLVQLSARDDELTAVIERATAERDDCVQRWWRSKTSSMRSSMHP